MSLPGDRTRREYLQFLCPEKKIKSIDPGSGRESRLKRPLFFLDQMRNAKGPRRHLWHADLAQLIEQRAITDLEPLCCLLPVPAVFLKYLQNDLAFKILGCFLGYVLERNRLAQVDLGDDALRR